MTVRAMKSGAIDFLTKPVRDQDMLDAVQAAIERDRKRRDAEKSVSSVRTRFEGLTARQRDILALVASGLMNKQVAAELGLAEITVKIYRGQIMRKMGAKSLADLVRMTEVLGIPRPGERCKPKYAFQGRSGGPFSDGRLRRARPLPDQERSSCQSLRSFPSLTMIHPSALRPTIC